MQFDPSTNPTYFAELKNPINRAVISTVAIYDKIGGDPSSTLLEILRDEIISVDIQNRAYFFQIQPPSITIRITLKSLAIEKLFDANFNPLYLQNWIQLTNAYPASDQNYYYYSPYLKIASIVLQEDNTISLVAVDMLQYIGQYKCNISSTYTSSLGSVLGFIAAYVFNDFSIIGNSPSDTANYYFNFDPSITLESGTYSYNFETQSIATALCELAFTANFADSSGNLVYFYLSFGVDGRLNFSQITKTTSGKIITAGNTPKVYNDFEINSDIILQDYLPLKNSATSYSKVTLSTITSGNLDPNNITYTITVNNYILNNIIALEVPKNQYIQSCDFPQNATISLNYIWRGRYVWYIVGVATSTQYTPINLTFTVVAQISNIQIKKVSTQINDNSFGELEIYQSAINTNDNTSGNNLQGLYALQLNNNTVYNFQSKYILPLEPLDIVALETQNGTVYTAIFEQKITIDEGSEIATYKTRTSDFIDFVATAEVSTSNFVYIEIQYFFFGLNNQPIIFRVNFEDENNEFTKNTNDIDRVELKNYLQNNRFSSFGTGLPLSVENAVLPSIPVLYYSSSFYSDTILGFSLPQNTGYLKFSLVGIWINSQQAILYAYLQNFNNLSTQTNLTLSRLGGILYNLGYSSNTKVLLFFQDSTATIFTGFRLVGLYGIVDNPSVPNYKLMYNIQNDNGTFSQGEATLTSNYSLRIDAYNSGSQNTRVDLCIHNFLSVGSVL